MPNTNNQNTPTTYTFVKRLNEQESGKNKSAAIVFSYSHKTQNKKVWIAKPFGPEYDLSERTILTYLKYFLALPFMQNYRLDNAAMEVFFGHLASEIFGKAHSPKTKFILQQRGVVSRLIGDGATTNVNFNVMLNSDRVSKLTLDEQKLLLNAVLYGIIIGDRDLSSGNLVGQLQGNNINSRFMNIYGIDHEFALRVQQSKNDLSLMKLLEFLYIDPKKIARVICDQRLGWNNAKQSYSILRMSESITAAPYSLISEHVEGLLTDSLNKELFIDSLGSIVAAISVNDYQICYKVKEKIVAKITSPGAVYTPFEVNRIIGAIDTSIAKLQLNVGNTKDFITEKKSVKCRLI